MTRFIKQYKRCCPHACLLPNTVRWNSPVSQTLAVLSKPRWTQHSAVFKVQYSPFHTILSKFKHTRLANLLITHMRKHTLKQKKNNSKMEGAECLSVQPPFQLCGKGDECDFNQACNTSCIWLFTYQVIPSGVDLSYYQANWKYQSY